MTADDRFPGWEIMAGAGGGYIAYRVILVPHGSGLSNVRCGATLDELHGNLAQELRREQQTRRLRRPARAA
ncbi:hypothetical protein [Nonomuraea candida]|uniref:hypothetical protein n=1 Tax=Nonomuraea candida TaxID=359159 RepID=UPI0012FA3772|nr:hypothetical protein [Nonomuraea candida]